MTAKTDRVRIYFGPDYCGQILCNICFADVADIGRDYNALRQSGMSRAEAMRATGEKWKGKDALSLASGCARGEAVFSDMDDREMKQAFGGLSLEEFEAYVVPKRVGKWRVVTDPLAGKAKARPAIVCDAPKVSEEDAIKAAMAADATRSFRSEVVVSSASLLKLLGEQAEVRATPVAQKGHR